MVAIASFGVLLAVSYTSVVAVQLCRGLKAEGEN